MLPLTWTPLVLGIAVAVLANRARVSAWTREAVAHGGVSEKAIAIELGRCLGKVSALISAGTLQCADLLALPPPVRDAVLIAMTRHAGLVTVRDALDRVARQQERDILAALAPSGRAVRCAVSPEPAQLEVA
jgi:hypothetical protein